MTTRRLILAASAVLLVGTLAGCSGHYPADPDGTLDRVTGGALRVGVSVNPPWTLADGDGMVSGSEVDLIDRFAAELDARPVYTVAGESELIKRLEAGTLDLIVGGLTDDSPWADKAALTRPYTEAYGIDGEREKHVMAAPLGENAFLAMLERFLDTAAPEVMS